MPKHDRHARAYPPTVRTAIDIWENQLHWDHLGRGRVAIMENIDPQGPINVASTAFMRYGGFFERLAPYIGPRFSGGVRATVACCSVGAEAYSLAMAFGHAGINVARIEAFDRSERLTAIARAAVYPRVMGLALKGPYIRAAQDVGEDGRYFTLSEGVADMVRIQEPALAQNAVLKSNNDVTMLFNTLIHLDSTSKKDVVAHLADATGHMFCFNAYDRPEVLKTGKILSQRGFAPLDAEFAPTAWEKAGSHEGKGFHGEVDTVIACIRVKDASSYTI